MILSKVRVFIFIMLWGGGIHSVLSQHHGLIDLREASLSDNAEALDGYWDFYPNHLFTYNSFDDKFRTSFAFPDVWKADSTIDFGTYRVRVIIPESARNTRLGVEVPHFFSSYSLWLKDSLLGTNGTPGTTRETTIPEWKPSVFYFEAKDDTLELILQVSNFYHATGGTRKSIRIAEASLLKDKMNLIMVTDYMLIVMLVTISLISLGFYYIIRDYRSPFLFLSFFVLAWALHSCCSNMYRIQDWITVPWLWLVKLEHLSIYFTIVTALMFVSSLFPKDFNSKVLKIVFTVLSALFSMFALLTEPVTFTAYLFVYMLAAICLIIYVIIVIAKAFVYERAGATLMLATILLGALTFGYVVLSYLGVIEINILVYNFSFVILYTLLAVSMGVRLFMMNLTEENEMLTFDQLYKDTVKY
ncbi:7TM-DISM domain-containing protein [Chryseosolibacter indicus]|uniref:7TM-DISM domain-containing protein n=1 Tax=Chryseosolibacter indicus TaxID=2782351 RepID=A0ABS5VPL1_9BACT|nr:7TM-DISM domain-containing protein [Chryseosolibacter indicus]MBT1703380.1 7TM-DISM domain-containing protein [Chryseosolibacter indicus]